MFNLKNSKFLKIGQIAVIFLITVVLISFISAVIAAPLGDIGGAEGDGTFLRLDNRTIAQFVKPMGGNKATYKVDNRSTKDYFVPLKTVKEWNSFLNNTPSNVNITLDPPYESCVPLQKECYTKQRCTSFVSGYNDSNCFFSYDRQSFSALGGAPCCYSSENIGCAFNPLSGGCLVDSIDQSCKLSSPSIYGEWNVGYWPITATKSYCLQATSMEDCLGNRGDHCTYIIPSIKCTNSEGQIGLYDPDAEICCAQIFGQQQMHDSNRICRHTGDCTFPKFNDLECRYLQ